MTTNIEPRSHLERRVDELESENKTLRDNLDFQRRRHDVERATMRNLLEEARVIRDTLTHAQQRGTELVLALREPSIIDEQVREFHDAMGIENRTTLGAPASDIVRFRCRLVIEEAFELIAASLHGDAGDDIASHLDNAFDLIECWPTAPDIVDVADALADLDYVVAGSRLAYGIQRKPVADEVHRSNMAKAPNGVVLRDEKKKVVKPSGWTPPNILKALGLEETAPRTGLRLAGWTCVGCSVFNGEEKETRETCRACGRDR